MFNKLEMLNGFDPLFIKWCIQLGCRVLASLIVVIYLSKLITKIIDHYDGMASCANIDEENHVG